MLARVVAAPRFPQLLRAALDLLFAHLLFFPRNPLSLFVRPALLRHASLPLSHHLRSSAHPRRRLPIYPARLPMSSPLLETLALFEGLLYGFKSLLISVHQPLVVLAADGRVLPRSRRPRRARSARATSTAAVLCGLSASNGVVVKRASSLVTPLRRYAVFLQKASKHDGSSTRPRHLYTARYRSHTKSQAHTPQLL